MSLLSIDFGSIAIGLDAVNTACNLGSIEILEASPKATGNFHFLAQGPHDLLLVIQENLTSQYDQIIDSALIQNEIKSLLDALYGLNKINLSESLLILETETLSTSLFISSECLKQKNSTLIELDSGRANGGISIAYLTGPEDSLKAYEEQLLKDRPARLRNLALIAKPNSNFSKYFTL